jgi:hypothetical protein
MVKIPEVHHYLHNVLRMAVAGWSDLVKRSFEVILTPRERNAVKNRHPTSTYRMSKPPKKSPSKKPSKKPASTSPLSPKTGGPFRIREILNGVGRREP